MCNRSTVDPIKNGCIGIYLTVETFFFNLNDISVVLILFRHALDKIIE